MRSFKNIITSIDARILTITLNRPSSLNALSLSLMQELEEVIALAKGNADIAGIILTGAGEKSFVAGADITEIASLTEESGKLFSKNGQKLFTSIETCKKPILAAVNGFALGGGCELAMACHIRIATQSAKFGQPEVNLGIIPGYGGTQRLTKLVGKGRALELMLTGNIIDSNEAYRIGLVNYLVEDIKALNEKSALLMAKIIANAPLAISKIIACVNTDINDHDYQIEADSFAYCCKTNDKHEGVQAFKEKRPPIFNGN